jgi:crossover junction endodeoxyribonuclease RuvC
MVLGIDLSLTGTGVVCLENGQIISQLLIKSTPNEKTTVAEMNRIKDILDKIESSISSNIFEAVAVEGVSFASKRTVSLSQLSGLNYLVRYNFIFDKWKNNLKDINKLLIVPPTVLKKFITGKGNSKKDVMLLETYKRYEMSFDNDNLCDAFGLAQIASVIVGESKVVASFQEEVITKKL